MKLRILLAFLFGSLSIFCQTTLGQWNDYLSYKAVIEVVEGGDKIYAACENSVFSYDRSDNSISRYSSVNFLSDKQITSLNWNEVTQTLIVGYSNGNVDLIGPTGSANFSDIKRSNITGNKSIFNFFIEDEFVYICTGFGIVKVDVQANEVEETYVIGPGGSEIAVTSVTKKDGKIYASTDIGVFEANENSALQDFNNWSVVSGLIAGNYDLVFNLGDQLGVYYNDNSEKRILMLDEGLWDVELEDSGIKKVLAHNNRLVVIRSNWAKIIGPNFQGIRDITDYSFTDNENMKTAYVDSENNIWIGDTNWGLLEDLGETNFNVFQPEGPEVNSTWKVDVVNEDLWIAHGGWNNTATSSFSESYFSGFTNGSWVGYKENSTLTSVSARDAVEVAVNPNNEGQVYFGMWTGGGGLVERNSDGSIKIYNNSLENTSLIQESFTNPGFYRVGGLTYDNDGNLWISNSALSNELGVRKQDGSERSFNLPGISETSKLHGLIHTSNDQIWGLNFNTSDSRLFVYDHNGTIDNENDDRFLKINTGVNNGGLPNNTILSVAEDLDGEIWIGTLEGPAIIFTPEFLFESNPPQAQQIKIEQDGNVELVLSTSAITSIAVDGANRKWLGTASSGAFLLSEDGTEEIYHFTEDNSPLLDNSIRDISINDKTGEVFFATDQGLLSFVGDATLGERENNCSNVFPNPVRPDYHGPIAIDGLARDSNVKITDIAGNVVYETVSNGGRAIWNGNNFSGQRVQSGVYLALVTSLVNDLETACISKIMVIN